jgi:hypothetical protein
MESEHLGDPGPGEDPLEALLRRHPGQGMPDGGFSARVLEALPPPRARIAWRRILLYSGGAGVGAAAAIATGNPLRVDMPTGEGLAAAASAAAAALGQPVNALTVIVVAAAAWYAWRGEWRLTRG